MSPLAGFFIGFGIFCGLFVLGVGIESGLKSIADAIRSKP